MPIGGTIEIAVARRWFDAASGPADSAIAPGEFVCLRVRDNGSGMTREVQSHLFEPFFTTKEAGKGTGLGLAFVYGIVRQHRGFITVDTAPAMGTTFTVCLPLAAGDATGRRDRAGAAIACRGTPGSDNSAGRGRPAVREVTTRTLQGRDITCWKRRRPASRPQSSTRTEQHRSADGGRHHAGDARPASHSGSCRSAHSFGCCSSPATATRSPSSPHPARSPSSESPSRRPADRDPRRAARPPRPGRRLISRPRLVARETPITKSRLALARRLQGTRWYETSCSACSSRLRQKGRGALSSSRLPCRRLSADLDRRDSRPVAGQNLIESSFILPRFSTNSTVAGLRGTGGGAAAFAGCAGGALKTSTSYSTFCFGRYPISSVSACMDGR